MLSRASHVSPDFLSAPDGVDRGRRPLRRRARVLGASLALCGVLSLTGSISLLAVLPAGAESLPARCDKVAAPTGSDSAERLGGHAAAHGECARQRARARPGRLPARRRLRRRPARQPRRRCGRADRPAQLPGRARDDHRGIYVPAGSNYVTFEGLSSTATTVGRTASRARPSTPITPRSNPTTSPTTTPGSASTSARALGLPTRP